MSVRFIVQGWLGGKKTERETASHKNLAVISGLEMLKDRCDFVAIEDLQARDASKSCVWCKEK